MESLTPLKDCFRSPASRSTVSSATSQLCHKCWQYSLTFIIYSLLYYRLKAHKIAWPEAICANDLKVNVEYKGVILSYQGHLEWWFTSALSVIWIWACYPIRVKEDANALLTAAVISLVRSWFVSCELTSFFSFFKKTLVAFFKYRRLPSTIYIITYGHYVAFKHLHNKRAINHLAPKMLLLFYRPLAEISIALRTNLQKMGH